MLGNLMSAVEARNITKQSRKIGKADQRLCKAN